MADEARTYEIEVFRVGPSSRGITAREVDEAVSTYDAEKSPAPLVFGHPTSDKPAHGWIAGLRREGDKLLATLKDVSAEAIEKVKAKAFRNRSIAFWHPEHSSNPAAGKWGIRHLGLLGAAQPGIPGMKPLTFSADDTAIESEEAPDPAVIFTDKVTDTVIIEEPKVSDPATVDKAEFDAAVAERDRLKAEADARAKKDEQARKDGNAAFVSDMVKEGRVTPGDRDFFTELLNRLPVEEIEFSADDKDTLGNRMRKLLSGAGPTILFSTISPHGDRGKGEDDPQAIADKAVAFQAEQSKLGRTISAAEAVAHVTSKGA
jgi:hypothetical protein